MTKWFKRPSKTTEAAKNLTKAQAEALADELTAILSDVELSRNEQAAQIAEVEAAILKQGDDR